MTPATERFWGAAGPLRTIQRFLDSRLGPLALALVLAVASTPIVAMGIIASTEGPASGYYEAHPLSDDLTLSMAFLAVIVGGLAGGALGGAIVRRHPVAGLFAAGFIAWPAAVATLPLVPGLTHQQFGAIFVCIDSCSPLLSGDALESGLTAYVGSQIVGMSLPIGVSVALTVATWFAGHRRHRWLATVLALGAVVSFNFVSMLAAVPAAVALVCGLALWTSEFRSPAVPRPEDATLLDPGAVEPH